jgi:hypothetical protein
MGAGPAARPPGPPPPRRQRGAVPAPLQHTAPVCIAQALPEPGGARCIVRWQRPGRLDGFGGPRVRVGVGVGVGLGGVGDGVRHDAGGGAFCRPRDRWVLRRAGAKRTCTHTPTVIRRMGKGYRAGHTPSPNEKERLAGAADAPAASVAMPGCRGRRHKTMTMLVGFGGSPAGGKSGAHRGGAGRTAPKPHSIDAHTQAPDRGAAGAKTHTQQLQGAWALLRHNGRRPRAGGRFAP